jgi:hypothetical protein
MRASGRGFEINAVTVPNVTMIGVVLALFMVNPDEMIRTEGTGLSPGPPHIMENPVYSLFMALESDGRVVLLFPMFYASK